MKRIKLIFLLYVLALTVAGCEMTKGAGKDLENTGDNIQEKVQSLESESQDLY